MVLEYEKSLAHWKHLTNRKEILVNWIETAEAKVNESIELIEHQGTGEGAEVWSRQLQEMRVGLLFRQIQYHLRLLPFV